MVEKDYLLVLVGNTQVGLIGLKEIFEELKSQRDIPESVLKERLVEKTAKKTDRAAKLIGLIREYIAE